MSAVRGLRARVRRRILVTYRVDPDVAADSVPAPFRPLLVNGWAVAGMCVIGTTALRPSWLPAELGLRSENAAHRIAVEWDEGGIRSRGVYIAERHSSTLLPVVAGGRIFPGVQRRARFRLDEEGERYGVRMTAPGMRLDLEVTVTPEAQWSSALFPDVGAASRFYEDGRIGWSPRRRGTGVEALELTSAEWRVEAARVDAIRSSWIDSLPPGAATLDSALVMRDLPFRWRVPSITPDRALRSPAVEIA